MRYFSVSIHSIILVCFATMVSGIERYVSPVGTHTAPFTTWETAATNIQAAVDAAVSGDVVWVTNGIYATGGKVMSSGLTNRVALDKALTVTSVNGPKVTTIQGAGATNGPNAVRCAWLTNQAVLQGFTLTAGATLTGSAENTGGGVWCASSNAAVRNSIVTSNSSSSEGVAAYSGTLTACVVISNQGSSSSSILYGSTLVNCTVSKNQSPRGIAPLCIATNTVFHYNSQSALPSRAVRCCATNSLTGSGNLLADPRLLADGYHLAVDSPCRSAGTNSTLGFDIDGDAWGTPPSIGCDEWTPQPAIVLGPTLQIASDGRGCQVSVSVAGAEPLVYQWYQNGTPFGSSGPALNAPSGALLSADSYQVVVSNAFGAVTSAVMRVSDQISIRYVDVGSSQPAAPFTNWSSAARTIQDAIDVAKAGDVVLVTNGIYQTGGRSMDGVATNRVVIDKAVKVLSVNGATFTAIEGAWDYYRTNGSTAMRCVWMTNNAVLGGFTVRGGATAYGPPIDAARGAGVFATSNNAVVSDCIITRNVASYNGGGACQATLVACRLEGNVTTSSDVNGGGGGASYSTLSNCVLIGNSAVSYGGGVSQCFLRNCALIANSSNNRGGGASRSTLVNCTVTRNRVGVPPFDSASGGGVADSNLTNCIVLWNERVSGMDNYVSANFSYSCSQPLPAGTGNITNDAKLLPDGYHLAADSPCLAAGAPWAAVGVDLDGQTWSNPPAMGCDAWQAVPVFSGTPNFEVRAWPVSLQITNPGVAGQGPFSFTWVKNGNPLPDDPRFEDQGGTNLIIRSLMPEDAGIYQLTASNSAASATSPPLRLDIHCVDAGATNAVAPFRTWLNAATTIQAAVDAADAGAVVLVTNGWYATGGRALVGNQTNRVAVTRSQRLVSVNGPRFTTIQGAFDPVTTNGTAAIRGAWISSEALLKGFTITNGATVQTNVTMGAGGGVWAASITARVEDCLIIGNSANQGGGVAYATVRNSLLWGNRARYGGGIYDGRVYNSVCISNVAESGGGVSNAKMVLQSTIVYNTAGTAGGIYSSPATNCIIYYNFASFSFGNFNGVLGANSIFSCCTAPAFWYVSTNSITADPQLIDGWHLAATSPCRGAGLPEFAGGTDLDGDPWNAPPSMGADEYVAAGINGLLTVAVSAAWPEVAQTGVLPLRGQVYGRADRVTWDFGDGTVLTNASLVNVSHSWNTTGTYTVTFTAYNLDHPDGVSDSLDVKVIPLIPPMATSVSGVGTNFSMGFPSQLGIVYTLERSTNLEPPTVWVPISNVYGTGGSTTLSDKRATNAVQFY